MLARFKSAPADKVDVTGWLALCLAGFAQIAKCVACVHEGDS